MAPRRRRLPPGISLDNIIDLPAVEGSSLDSTKRRMTRASLRPSNATPPLYDQKYHPIDDTTRPKSARMHYIRIKKKKLNTIFYVPDSEDSEDSQDTPEDELNTVGTKGTNVSPKKQRQRFRMSPQKQAESFDQTEVHNIVVQLASSSRNGSPQKLNQKSRQRNDQTNFEIFEDGEVNFDTDPISNHNLYYMEQSTDKENIDDSVIDEDTSLSFDSNEDWMDEMVNSSRNNQAQFRETSENETPELEIERTDISGTDTEYALNLIEPIPYGQLQAVLQRDIPCSGDLNIEMDTNAQENGFDVHQQDDSIFGAAPPQRIQNNDLDVSPPLPGSDEYDTLDIENEIIAACTQPEFLNRAVDGSGDFCSVWNNA